MWRALVSCPSRRCCAGVVDRSAKARGQVGQALVEWMVVAALAMLVAIWAAGEFAQKAEQAAANGYARWFQAVAGAVQEAMKHYDAGLSSGAGLIEQLPVNVLSPLDGSLVRLKQGGWLPAALSAKPKMPYDVRLARITEAGDCSAGRCPLTVLLLAMPRPNQQAPHPSTVLAALDGQGLAVTDLAPARLQGATYQFANPIANGVNLPVGTVGLLAWRSDKPPPYVRLHETRRVSLAGGVQLGRLAHVNGDCRPDGLVMVGPRSDLQICQGGRWQEVSERHDHVRACLPHAQSNNHILEGLLRVSGFWEIVGVPQQPLCECPAGFARFAPGGGAHLGSVKLLDGHACLRL